jgi:hypothetical protein
MPGMQRLLSEFRFGSIVDALTTQPLVATA